MSKRAASHSQFDENTQRSKKITNYIKTSTADMNNEVDDGGSEEEELAKFSWKTEYEKVFFTQPPEGGDDSEEFDTLYKLEVKLMLELKNGRKYAPRDIYIFIRKQADMYGDNECLTVHPLELDWMVKQMKENKSVRLKWANGQLWAERRQRKDGVFYTLGKRKRSQDKRSIVIPAAAANALIAEVDTTLTPVVRGMSADYKINSALEGREILLK